MEFKFAPTNVPICLPTFRLYQSVFLFSPVSVTFFVCISAWIWAARILMPTQKSSDLLLPFQCQAGWGGGAAKLHGEVTFPWAIRQTHGVGSSDLTSASTELKLNAISSHMILSSVLAWWRSVKINSSLCFQSQAPPNFGPVQEDACEEN